MANYPTIQIVASCPRGHALSNDCSQSDLADASWNYVHDVPLMDAQSGVWYRNIYCAVCHDVDEHLAPVNLSLKCSNNSKWEEIADIASYQGDLKWAWNVTTNDSNTLTNGSCLLEVTPPNWPSARRGLIVKPPTVPGFYRPCTPTVDSCPDTWADEDTADKCRSYAYFMKTRTPQTSSTIFKNAHCVICNGHSTFICHNHRLTIMRTSTNKWKPPSLSMVLNFQWDFEGEAEWRKTTSKCSPPYGLFDAINKRCQHLKEVCDYGYHYENHKCVSNTGDLTLLCPKRYLTAGQFRIMENGSLLKHGDALYPEVIIGRGYFEILENGTASVCLILGESQNYGLGKVITFSQQFEGIISCICFTISIVCLILHIVTYLTVPKLRNLPGKNLLALSWCLLLAQLLFMFGSHPIIDVDPDVCVAIATVTHFLFLAAFFWMNVMSFDIWRKFSSRSIHCSSPVSLHRKYAMYAWTMSGTIVLIATLVDRLQLLPEFARPNYGRGGLCWIGSPLGIGIFFAAPVIFIVLSNMFLFATTVFKIKKQKRESASYIKKRTRDERLQCRTRSKNGMESSLPDRESGIAGKRDQIRVYLYIKLFMIMGLTWVFGIVNGFIQVQILWYPFIILNALQGTFIFFMFDCKKSIGTMFWERTVGGKYEVPEFLKASKSSERSKTESMTCSSTRLRKESSSRNSNTMSVTGVSSTAISALPDPGADHVDDPTAERLIRLRNYSRSTSCEVSEGTDASTEENFIFNHQVRRSK